MWDVGRRAKKWFSYDIPVDSAKPVAVVVTFNTDERGRDLEKFLSMVNEWVNSQSIEAPGSAAGRFFDVEYKIPRVVEGQEEGHSKVSSNRRQ